MTVAPKQATSFAQSLQELDLLLAQASNWLEKVNNFNYVANYSNLQDQLLDFQANIHDIQQSIRPIHHQIDREQAIKRAQSTLY